MAAPAGEDQVESSAATVAAAPPSQEEEISTSLKLRGAVKWFNSSKGYGFITPGAEAGGSEDVFVHQTAIHAQGFRSLQQGEEVEYVAQEGEDGRMRAVEVKGPNGGYVQGASRYGSKGGGGGGGGGGGRGVGRGGSNAAPAAAPRPLRGLQQGFRFGGVCYTCGLVGHMSRDCRSGAAYYPPPPPPTSARGRGHVPPHLRLPDTRSCYSCGAVGHLQRDCPNFGPA